MREWYAVRPPPALAHLVTGMCGYRLEGYRPGVHVGMPSPALTVVVALGEPIVVAAPGRPPRPYQALASGLCERAVAIHHDGNQHGIQLDLTPDGARALLGFPAAQLARDVVDLEPLLHPADRFLAEQATATTGWPQRLDLVLTALARGLDRAREPRPEVAYAWTQVTGSYGRLPVRAVADAVGWSTRHLGEMFRAEFGLGVKTTARVARFSRSRDLVASGRVALADVAVHCGYADQAHLSRDWRDLAGTTPTRWLRDDDLAFVQDDRAGAVAG